jgi:integrase
VSTILEKITEAAESGSNACIRVNRQPLNLYSLTKAGKPYWVLSWYEGRQRIRKQYSRIDALLDSASFVINAVGDGRAVSLADETEEVGKIPVKELLEFYKRHHPDLKETFASPTTRALADEFIKAAEKAGRSERHIQTITSHLKKFCTHTPDKIRKVSVYDIDDYLHTLSNRKTRLNHRITLVALFRFAQRKGYLDENTKTAAEQTDRPKTTVKEPEVFTATEMTALLNGCTRPQLKAFLTLGGFCGLRSAEICRLDWSQVKDDHIILGAGITKTARRRIAEIPDNAREWLLPLRKDKGPVSYQSSDALYAQLRALCAKAGLVWKDNGLRHSFASYHLEFHRDPPRTSKTAGHSLRLLETVYAKLVSREDAIRWFSTFPTTPERSNDNEPKTPRQESTHLQRTAGHEGAVTAFG